jgi:xylulokinase
VDAATGALVREGRAAHPDGTEVDPEHWWTALEAALAEAGGLADVAAISIAGQQHGMVVLDEHGRVIRPALLWNDTRSAAAAVDLAREVPDIVARSGSQPVASFTSTKLRWLRDNEPDNAERVAAVALPHDWLTWRLRGFGPGNPDFDELTTDRSDASGTGYWNPATNDYDRELLRVALGRDAIVPRVLGPDDSAGEVGAIVVAAGAGDNASAALGLGAIPGDVVVSIGTSGTVFAVTPNPTAVANVAGFAATFSRYSLPSTPLECWTRLRLFSGSITRLLVTLHSPPRRGAPVSCCNRISRASALPTCRMPQPLCLE